MLFKNISISASAIKNPILMKFHVVYANNIELQKKMNETALLFEAWAT